jgi:hypothetical protein
MLNTSAPAGKAPAKESSRKHCRSQKSKSSAVLRGCVAAATGTQYHQRNGFGPEDHLPQPSTAAARTTAGREGAQRRSRRPRPRGRTAARPQSEDQEDAPRHEPRASTHTQPHSGAAAERRPRGRTAAQTAGEEAHRPAQAGQAASTGRRARAGHAARTQEPPASRGEARGPRGCNHRAHWECGNESNELQRSPRHTNFEAGIAIQDLQKHSPNASVGKVNVNRNHKCGL